MSEAIAKPEIPSAYDIPLEDVNPIDGRLFQNDAHWSYFERLRNDDPALFFEIFEEDVCA